MIDTDFAGGAPGSPAGAGFPPCRICGGALVFKFSSTVLGHVAVDYCECRQCRSLIAPFPTWLDQAYSIRLSPDPDQGALLRTLFIYRAIRRLRSSPTKVIRRRCSALDFGCGYGFLLRLLSDDGHDVAGVDQYPRAIFCEDKVSRSLPEGRRFDLVIASEVVEHLTSPADTLRDLRSVVSDSGLVIITTELYVSGLHGASWHYLVPTHGQHVTFYSETGLRLLMERSGLEFVGSHKLFGQPFLFIFAPKTKRGIRWRWPLISARQAAGEAFS